MEQAKIKAQRDADQHIKEKMQRVRCGAGVGMGMGVEVGVGAWGWDGRGRQNQNVHPHPWTNGADALAAGVDGLLWGLQAGRQAGGGAGPCRARVPARGPGGAPPPAPPWQGPPPFSRHHPSQSSQRPPPCTPAWLVRPPRPDPHSTSLHCGSLGASLMPAIPASPPPFTHAIAPVRPHRTTAGSHIPHPCCSRWRWGGAS